MSEHGELVLYDVAYGVCTLTLNNPERRNAWSRDMEHRYFSLLDRAAADPAVRAIVVTGSGRSFCPGLDTQRLAAEAKRESSLDLAGRRPQHFPLTVPKPMIAAINGACAGIGLVQALVCDVRFAARGRASRPRTRAGGCRPSTARRGCYPGSSVSSVRWISSSPRGPSRRTRHMRSGS